MTPPPSGFVAEDVLTELDKFDASRRWRESELTTTFATAISGEGFDLVSYAGRWDREPGSWAADDGAGAGPSADQLETQAIVERRKRYFEEMVERFGEAAPPRPGRMSWYAEPSGGAVELLSENDARRRGFTIGPFRSKREAQRGFVESRRLPPAVRPREPPALQDLGPVREHVLELFARIPKTGLPATGIQSDIQIRRGLIVPLYQVNQVLRELEREGKVHESVPGVYDLGPGPLARVAPKVEADQVLTQASAIYRRELAGESVPENEKAPVREKAKELGARFLRITTFNAPALGGFPPERVGVGATFVSFYLLPLARGQKPKPGGFVAEFVPSEKTAPFSALLSRATITEFDTIEFFDIGSAPFEIVVRSRPATLEDFARLLDEQEESVRGFIKKKERERYLAELREVRAYVAGAGLAAPPSPEPRRVAIPPFAPPVPDLDLRPGATQLYYIEGRWVASGDYAHVDRADILHNVRRLGSLFELYGPRFTRAFGIGKPYPADQVYIFVERGNKRTEKVPDFVLDIEQSIEGVRREEERLRPLEPWEKLVPDVPPPNPPRLRLK
jgi:hypothetical protein